MPRPEVQESACPLCEGEGQIVQGISIYSKSHAYPEIVQCPDCGGTGKKAARRVYVVNVSDLADDQPGRELLPTHARVVIVDDA